MQSHTNLLTNLRFVLVSRFVRRGSKLGFSTLCAAKSLSPKGIEARFFYEKLSFAKQNLEKLSFAKQNLEKLGFA